MLNLLRAELLKLLRRPLSLVLLLIFLFTLIAQLSLEFLVLAFDDGLFGAQYNLALVLPEAVLEQYRLQLAFPGLFGTVLGHTNSLGGIVAIILTAGAVGSEYNWGTLRTMLLRRPDRRSYLLAKAAALLCGLGLGILIALLLGSVIGAGFAALLGRLASLQPLDLLLLPLGILRSLYVLLPYVLLTLFFSVLGRSVLAGAAGGLIYLSLELSLATLALFRELSGPLALLYNLTIQPNINRLVVQNALLFGLNPAASGQIEISRLPPQPQAIVVVAVYSAALLYAAISWLRRHDIGGAA